MELQFDKHNKYIIETKPEKLRRKPTIDTFKSITKKNRCQLGFYIRHSSEWFSSLSNDNLIPSTFYSSALKANISKLLFINQNSI